MTAALGRSGSGGIHCAVVLTGASTSECHHNAAGPPRLMEWVQAAGRRGSPADGRTIVIDAYALGILPRLGQEIRPWAGHLILTPNPTESVLLLGRDLTDLPQTRPKSLKNTTPSSAARASSPNRRTRTGSNPPRRAAGRPPPGPAVWEPPAAVTSWPALSPGDAPAAPQTRRPPAGAPTSTPLPGTGRQPQGKPRVSCPGTGP